MLLCCMPRVQGAGSGSYTAEGCSTLQPQDEQMDGCCHQPFFRMSLQCGSRGKGKQLPRHEAAAQCQAMAHAMLGLTKPTVAGNCMPGAFLWLCAAFIS